MVLDIHVHAFNNLQAFMTSFQPHDYYAKPKRNIEVLVSIPHWMPQENPYLTPHLPLNVIL